MKGFSSVNDSGDPCFVNVAIQYSKVNISSTKLTTKHNDLDSRQQAHQHAKQTLRQTTDTLYRGQVAMLVLKTYLQMKCSKYRCNRQLTKTTNVYLANPLGVQQFMTICADREDYDLLQTMLFPNNC